MIMMQPVKVLQIGMTPNSERLFNVWLERQNLKKCEVPVVFLENIDWPKKIADFLKRKVTGKR